MSKDTFTYYAIQIYDDQFQQHWTYETFRSKANAEQYLKEKHINPNAKVNEIKIKFKD